MSDQTNESERPPLALPDNPNLDWLRKQAKRRLDELRVAQPAAQLADAQFDVAKQYGFSSWRALKAHVDALSIDGQLSQAARDGDVRTLESLLDAHPDKLTLGLKPYGMTLLHVAAQHGHLRVVDLLLERGIDVNARESGDNTCAMHWAAAGGHLDVVRRLADAGGDVIGHGDDHELEVIGWATCWNRCDDDAHRAVAEFLTGRGAHHHIFSAIALDLGDEVRRIVSRDPRALNQRMSRNENNQLPLHFAVRMNRRAMVELLLELGADPLGPDGSGMTVAAYAESPDRDLAVMERIRDMTSAELLSAERGHRAPRSNAMDLVAALALSDWPRAETLVRDSPHLLGHEATSAGVLHLMAKRGATDAVRWLIERGIEVDARWAHWDSEVTAMHLAILANHPDIMRLLLDAGADPTIRDTKHDSDARGWAEFFGRGTIVEMIDAQR